MPGGFKRLSDVDVAFYRLFNMGAADPRIQLGSGKSAQVRYYKRGGGTDAQDKQVEYPVVSIQNFPPEIDTVRRVRVPAAYEGDFTGTGPTLKGRLVPYPLPLNFRYQVSVASTTQITLSLLQEWFFRNFDVSQPQMSLLLDVTETLEHGLLGEPVPYTLKVREVSRDDKVFEIAYDFVLKPWVDVLAPSAELDTLQAVDLLARILALPE